MNIWFKVLVTCLFFLVIITGGLLFLEERVNVIYWAATDNWGRTDVNTVIEPSQDVRLFFTGDIMLARDVERRILHRSSDSWLFNEIDHLFTQADMVMGNFEASIPEVHAPTMNMEMKFSVLPEISAQLASSGFTHLSLANNHAFDFGVAGYSNTIKTLESQGLEVAGSPNNISTSSIFIKDIADIKFVIVNINATYSYPEISSVISSLPRNLKDQDVLVAYIHWGDEYELVHNLDQQRFAHSLVDAGFDLIIGHHPHVVQDIEKYKGKVIFYSLGNFIFDQYWNDEVRTGLILELVYSGTDSFIKLIPTESITERVQPRIMEGELRSNFLENLATRSSGSLRNEILAGVISLQF